MQDIDRTSSHRNRRTYSDLGDYLLPVSALAANLALSTALLDPVARAETVYLAILAFLVLTAIAALSVRPVWILGGATLTVTTLLWALPAGSARGSSTVLVLTLALILAVSTRLCEGETYSEHAFVLPAALGAQFLFRSDLLLTLRFDTSHLVDLIALPLIGGLALAALLRKGPNRLLLPATAAALSATSGWTVEITLTVLALHLATELSNEDQRPLFAGLLVGTVAVAAMFSPQLAVLVLATCALYWGSRFRAVRYSAFFVTAIYVGSLIAFGQVHLDSIHGVSWLLILLPASLVVSASQYESFLIPLTLAVMGVSLTSSLFALVPSLLLAGLLMKPSGQAIRLQTLWSGILFALSLLLASYPWLRPIPLPPAAALFGIRPHGLHALAVLLTFGGIVAVASFMRLRQSPPRIDPFLAGIVVVAGAAILALPSSRSIQLTGDIVSLSAESPLLSVKLEEPLPASQLVIDSYLSGSDDLPAGTVVASARLISTNGDYVEHELRSGLETGEWAARREDVASRPGFVAPTPWLSWVEPSRTFYAQRYRDIWHLESRQSTARVEIERRQGLEPRVGIEIFFAEVRP